MASFLLRRPKSLPLFGLRSLCSARKGKVVEIFREEFEVASGITSIETGRLVPLANGGVVISMNDDVVLSTVASARGDAARDFLPITVDLKKKQSFNGVIPTTFMRREGAAMIDRSIRPLFPAGFYHEIQVMVSVLCSDGKQDPDVMAANATSAALMLSDVPWNGPIGVIRVGRIDGNFIFNPTMDELTLSDLDLVYGCTKDKTLMIDVHAREITEKDLKTGLILAHSEAVKYIDPQIRLSEKAGKKKREYKLSMISERTQIRSIAKAPIEAVFTDSTYGKVQIPTEAVFTDSTYGNVQIPIEAVFTDSTYGKMERDEALDNIIQTVKAKLEEECDEES